MYANFSIHKPKAFNTGVFKMKLSVEYMRKSITENQLDYVTIKSINHFDYDKINLIIALSTGFAPNNQDIYNLIQSFNNDEKEYKDNQDNLEQDYINKHESNI